MVNYGLIMLYVVDKYDRDFYGKRKLLAGWSLGHSKSETLVNYMRV